MVEIWYKFSKNVSKLQHFEMSVCCILRSLLTTVACCLCICGQTVLLEETAHRALWGKDSGMVLQHISSPLPLSINSSLRFFERKKNFHYLAWFWEYFSYVLKDKFLHIFFLNYESDLVSHIVLWGNIGNKPRCRILNYGK